MAMLWLALREIAIITNTLRCLTVQDVLGAIALSDLGFDNPLLELKLPEFVIIARLSE